MHSPNCLKRTLTRWLVTHRGGKTPTTRRYHWQTVKQIRRAWRSILTKPVDEVNADDVARFALAADRFCASRWNGMLTVLYVTVPAAKVLKRRPAKLTRQPPPTQTEFAKLIAECEHLAVSHAGLVVDFLAHSGMRITAARNVRWSDVYQDRIEYVGKGGRVCSVPIINGMRDVLARLRGRCDLPGFVSCHVRRSGAAWAKRASVRGCVGSLTMISGTCSRRGALNLALTCPLWRVGWVITTGVRCCPSGIFI